MVKKIRINKYLTLCNLGSRRKVEIFIKEGLVSVNDKIVKDLSSIVDPDKDIVLFKGKKLTHINKYTYIILNKPKNYTVTKEDKFAKQTVYDLLKDLNCELFPVGRLDKDSEGLLLFTNDGELANLTTKPKSKIEKTYKVWVKGSLDKEKIKSLRTGINIDDYVTKPARVFIKTQNKDQTLLRIVLTEGKNRQIRRMIENINCSVISLKRTQIGNIKIGKLQLGEWRFLRSNEIEQLKQTIHGDKNEYRTNRASKQWKNNSI